MISMVKSFSRKLVEELDDLNGLKFQLTLMVELRKAEPNAEDKMIYSYFGTKKTMLM